MCAASWPWGRASMLAADPSDNSEILEVDFGWPCADPQPAVDPQSPVDRLTRKTPRSNPAMPLTQPPYPHTARMMGWEGQIILSLLINEKGNVSRARIHRGARYPILNEAALEHTRNWKLRPGTAQEKPVCMWGNFAVTFKLMNYDDAALARVPVTSGGRARRDAPSGSRELPGGPARAGSDCA